MNDLSTLLEHKRSVSDKRDLGACRGSVQEFALERRYGASRREDQGQDCENDAIHNFPPSWMMSESYSTPVVYSRAISLTVSISSPGPSLVRQDVVIENEFEMV
jgi:hypothetical protein